MSEIGDLQFAIADSDCRSAISDCRFLIVDLQFPIADFQFRGIRKIRFEICNLKSAI